jgi:hypothetical protein
MVPDAAPVDTAAVLPPVQPIEQSPMITITEPTEPVKAGKNKKGKVKTVVYMPPPPLISPPATDSIILQNVPIYEEPRPVPDTTASPLNFMVDTIFIMHALDSFVLQYNQPDSVAASLVLGITAALDEYYCPFFVSKLLSPNDTIFAPSPSFAYLFKHYNTFRKMRFATDMYHEHYYKLYEVLSKRLNRFIRYNESGNYQSVRKAIVFQQQFIQAIAEHEALEKPLLMANILDYNGKMEIDDLFTTAVAPYMDQLLAAKPDLPAYISSLAKKMGQSWEREMDYVVWNHSIGELPGYSTATGYKYYYPTYFKDKFGYLLNNSAWYLYGHRADTAALGQAIRYSIAALRLKPQDPFFLDTYAHVLYKKGYKAAALVQQQKAVTAASALKRDYEMKQEEVDIFIVELQKMKAGHLQ